MASNINMGNYFDSAFSLIIANTPKLQQEVYKIRYQVYCQELQYEPQENFPNQMEKDKFDERSIHILLKYKPSDSYIACVRIVLADPNQPEEPFPFEIICQHNVNFNQQPRNNFFEISRLAVVSEFRRRAGEENTSHGLLYFKGKPPEETKERRNATLIAMSLYLACTSIGISLGFNYALSLMEVRLHRHLKWCGLPAHPIGNFVEFHGKRGPFVFKREEVLTSMNSHTRELFDKIYAQLNKSSSCNISKRKYRSNLPNFLRTAYGLA